MYSLIVKNKYSKCLIPNNNYRNYSSSCPTPNNNNKILLLGLAVIYYLMNKKY